MQAMKPFHLVCELRRKRNRRLEHHASLHIRWPTGCAVEAEPRLRIDDLAFAIDEIGDPKRVIAQIDRDLPSPAKAKQLTLNGPVGWVADCHRMIVKGPLWRRSSFAIRRPVLKKFSNIYKKRCLRPAAGPAVF
jgi:hypothetical protein